MNEATGGTGRFVLYLVGNLLPLSWVIGASMAMSERSAYLKTHYALYLAIHATLIVLVCVTVGDMYGRGIRGWRWFFCALAMLMVILLVLWLYLGS